MSDDSTLLSDSATSKKSTTTTQNDLSTSELVKVQSSNDIAKDHIATANSHDIITVVRDPRHPLGNGHMFIRVANPDDVGRARGNIIPRAIELGLAWPKPKYSSTNPGEIVAHSWATLIDPSVWDVSRLIFCGKPTVRGELKVLPPEIKILVNPKNSIL